MSTFTEDRHNIEPVIQDADNIFSKVQKNEASPDNIARLLEIDSGLVDDTNFSVYDHLHYASLRSRLDSERYMPEHLKSLVRYFEIGESLSSFDLVNMAASAYFAIFDLSHNHDKPTLVPELKMSVDSIESIEYHLGQLTRQDLIIDDISDEGTQFVAINTQDREPSKYFISERGFVGDTIYEVINAERTRIRDGEFPVFSDLFVAIRKRDETPSTIYTAGMDFRKPLGICAFRPHIHDNIRKMLMDNQVITPGLLQDIVDTYSPKATSLQGRRYISTLSNYDHAFSDS